MTKDKLDMFDEARAMVATLKLCGITQDELAERLGVSQSYVANKLRLLKLEKEEVELIQESKLTERHARAVLRLDNKEKRLEALRRTIEMGLNVRECEAVVELLREADLPKGLLGLSPSLSLDRFLEVLKESLSNLRSTGVKTREYTERLGGKLYITLAIELP